jgi:hypothetical protein
MRLLLILSAAVLASIAAAAPQAAIRSPDNCPVTSRYEAAQRDDRALFRRLGDLPPADAYKAVLRHNGRCNDPIIAGYDYGSPGGPKPPPRTKR